MRKKRYTSEQIINHLRTIEVLAGQGKTIAEACRSIGISEQTYYKWRKEYGGMQVSQAKRLKELEIENTRLKKAIANLTLDNLLPRETSKPGTPKKGCYPGNTKV